MHAIANTPAGPLDAVVVSSSEGRLPRCYGGSAPAFSVSRPAQRSLTLRPPCSRSHHLWPVLPKYFNDFVASVAASVATGWTTRCRAGFTPADNRCLCTAYGTLRLGERLHFGTSKAGKNGIFRAKDVVV